MGRPATRRAPDLPWPVFVGVALLLAPLPQLPVVLSPPAFDTLERLDPGSREFVHGNFTLGAGDALAGEVSVVSGPAVAVFVMTDDAFAALQEAGFVEPVFAASGALVNISFVARAHGTYHLLVGHSWGNESAAVTLAVRVRVVINLSVAATSIMGAAAGGALLLAGLRLWGLEAMAREAERPPDPPRKSWRRRKAGP